MLVKPCQTLPGRSSIGTGKEPSPEQLFPSLPPHVAPPPVPFLRQLTHEVVVPGPLCWDHEEAEEAIGQQHLHPLVMGGQVALGVVPFVRVLPAPLVATGGQFVGCQRAGTRRKTERKERWGKSNGSGAEEGNQKWANTSFSVRFLV